MRRKKIERKWKNKKERKKEYERRRRKREKIEKRSIPVSVRKGKSEGKGANRSYGSNKRLDWVSQPRRQRR